MNKDNPRTISINVNRLTSVSTAGPVPSDGHFTVDVPINSLTPNSPGKAISVPESWGWPCG